MLSTNLLQLSIDTCPIGVLPLPGADWPMLTALLIARGIYTDSPALARDCGVTESVVEDWLDAELSPREVEAARLLDRAHQHLAPADRALADIDEHAPYWFRVMPEGRLATHYL